MAKSGEATSIGCRKDRAFDRYRRFARQDPDHRRRLRSAAPTRSGLTPQQMADAVTKLAEGLSYGRHLDGLSWPGHPQQAVGRHRQSRQGLGRYDFAAQFGKPVKIVNDALMQAVGSYEGGACCSLGWELVLARR